MTSGLAVNPEEERIRETYARRARRRHWYSWFNAAYVFMAQERERAVLQALAENGMAHLADKRILDVGCGAGAWLQDFLKWGASPENLWGIDLLAERVEQARRLLPSAAQVRCGSARSLDVPAGSFDVALQSTVFTSILDPELKRQIAKQMMRAVDGRGLILWYDYRVDNPSNPDVRGVGRSEIRKLFPHCDVRLRPVTLAPPLLRGLAPQARPLCLLLEKLPWLCTHYLGVIRPPGVMASGVEDPKC